MAPPPNTGEDVEKMVMHLLLVGTLNGTATLENSFSGQFLTTRRQRQENQEFKARLGYKRSLRLVWAT